MFAFLNAHGSELITKTWEQLYISAIALGLGVIVAVPLGILLTRFPKTAKVVIFAGINDSFIRDWESTCHRCIVHLLVAANFA